MQQLENVELGEEPPQRRKGGPVKDLDLDDDAHMAVRPHGVEELKTTRKQRRRRFSVRERDKVREPNRRFQNASRQAPAERRLHEQLDALTSLPPKALTATSKASTETSSLGRGPRRCRRFVARLLPCLC